MIDYSHIPIHIRCTNRNLIDPRYTPDGYRRYEDIIDRFGYKRHKPFRNKVPEVVLDWLAENPKACGAAAVELGMMQVDLVEVVKYHRYRKQR